MVTSLITFTISLVLLALILGYRVWQLREGGITQEEINKNSNQKLSASLFELKDESLRLYKKYRHDTLSVLRAVTKISLQLASSLIKRGKIFTLQLVKYANQKINNKTNRNSIQQSPSEFLNGIAEHKEKIRNGENNTSNM